MKVKITEKGIEHLKSLGIIFFLKKKLFEEICITQKEWDNMSKEEKEKLMEEVYTEIEK